MPVYYHSASVEPVREAEPAGPMPTDSIPLLIVPVKNGAHYLDRLVRSIDFPVQRVFIPQDGYDASIVATVKVVGHANTGLLLLW